MKKLTVLITLLMFLFVFANTSFSATVVVQDDFNDPASEMPTPGTAPNTNPAWRWGEQFSTRNQYDGSGVLLMPMRSSGGYEQFIDTDVALNQGTAYALVYVFNSPPNDVFGDLQFGFAGGENWNSNGSISNSRVFYLSGANLLFCNRANGPTGGLPAYSLGPINTDTPQSLMIRIAANGLLQIFYFDGVLKDPESPNWEERVPSGNGNPAWLTLASGEYGPNKIGVNHFYGAPRPGGDYKLDFIGLFSLTAGPTPTATPSATPTPVDPWAFIEDDFNDPAGDMPNADEGAPPIPTGGNWESLSQNARNAFDGNSNLLMPRFGMKDQYIDSHRFFFDFVPSNYAFVCIFRMPADAGTQALGFNVDENWGVPERHRVFKLNGGQITFSNDTFGTSPLTLNTGRTYVPGQPQGLMISTNAAGAIRLWYQNGGDKSTNSSAWQEFTPSSDPDNLLHFGFGINSIGVTNVDGASGTFTLDYIAAVSNPALPAGGTPTATATSTPSATDTGTPNGIGQSWYLYD